MATILCHTRWGDLPVRAAEYKVDVTTHYGVMAHFTCIIKCRCDLDLWPTITIIGSCDQDPIMKTYAYFEVNRPLLFEIYGHKVQTSWPHCQATGVAMATSLCPTRLWVVHMSAPNCEVNRHTQEGVMVHFTWIHFVPVWPWPLTYFHKNWVT